MFDWDVVLYQARIYFRVFFALLVRHKKQIGYHMKNLGIAGYTGAYVHFIQLGIDLKCILLLATGVLFTFLANRLER